MLLLPFFLCRRFFLINCCKWVYLIGIASAHSIKHIIKVIIICSRSQPSRRFASSSTSTDSMRPPHAWLPRRHRPHCVVVLPQSRIWRLLVVNPLDVIEIIQIVVILRRYIFHSRIVVVAAVVTVRVVLYALLRTRSSRRNLSVHASTTGDN